MENNYKILFCSVVEEYFESNYLALIELKSFLAHRDKNVDIQHTRVLCEAETDEIASQILSYGRKLIGFSVFLWNYEKVVEISRRLKEKSQDLIIIVGGPTPTYQAEEMLQDCDAIDIAVVGQGEETLYQLLGKIIKDDFHLGGIPNIVYKENGKVIKNPYKENCDIANHHYPLLTEELEDLSVVYYETSRGCLFKCKYCAYRLNFQGRNIVKYYPLEKVFRDLDHIFKLKAIKQLIVFDTNLVYAGLKEHKKHGLSVVRYINKLNKERSDQGLTQVQVEIDTQPDDLDDEVIEELKRLNAYIYSFGLQSIDPRVLKLANRRFNKEKFIENICKFQQKSGAPIYIEIIYGMPGDSLESFKKSLEFVLSEIKPYFVYCYHFKLLPGSTFWEEKDRLNLVYSERPPYNIVATNSFPEEDLRTAAHITCFLRVIYIVFRGIRNAVEKYYPNYQLQVYEKMIDFIFDQYKDLFDPDNLTEETVYQVIKTLRNKSNSKLRFQMKKDMRKMIEQERKTEYSNNLQPEF